MRAAGRRCVKWRRGVFGEPYMVWHDGPGFDDLARSFAEDPDQVTAMLAAGSDHSDLVRYHSAATMLGWAGRMSTNPSDDDALFALIRAHGRPEDWATAADLLRAEVEGIV